jgi:tetratricopeptide (TPR) repeat protein
MTAINSILALQTQMGRIESNTASTNSASQEILTIIRRMASDPVLRTEIVGAVRQLETNIRRRATPLPARVDPEDLVARVSSLHLSDEFGCPLTEENAPQGLPTTYQRLIIEGDELAERHGYSAAIRLYDQAINTAPQIAFGHYKRARALCQNRDYLLALESLDRTLRLAPRHHGYYVARAQLLFRLRRFREAAQAFRQARDRDARNASLAWGEGEALRRAEDCRSALAAFTAATDLDPRYVTAYMSRARCRLALSTPAAAVTDISTVLNFDARNREARELLTRVYRILASDRVLSAQADYRYFADQEDRQVQELDRRVEEQRRLEDPAVNCVETALPDGRANGCRTSTFYIPFDRGESYLSQRGARQFERLIERSRTCQRMIMRLMSFADIGEDDFSQGLDLANARASFMELLIMRFIATPGVYSVTFHPPREFVLRMNDERGLLGLFRSARGYEGRPVPETGGRPDERNQVVNVTLVCEP